MVGAGPAGSVSAFLLAHAGLSVLLLDRARFPRDKPCGGGVTWRAAQVLPFSIEPVVEHVVDCVEFGLLYSRRFDKQSEAPLIYMTQRSKLDAFLVGKAVDAGAVFRDGVKVTNVKLEEEGAVVRGDGWTATGRAVVGADGANGTTAASLLGARPLPQYFIALEGNVSHRALDPDRYKDRVIIELGVVPGGYAWVFPKGDHVNFGVAGWPAEGVRLRAHLARLLEHHGLEARSLEAVRGYRLPFRRPGQSLATGCGILVGDAAGVIDPLLGDGIFGAFVTARLASEAVLGVVRGRQNVLRYPQDVLDHLGSLCAASWDWKFAFDRFPRLSYAIARTPPAWRVIIELLRGDLLDPDAVRGTRSIPLSVLSLLGNIAGAPGKPYRRELEGARRSNLQTNDVERPPLRTTESWLQTS